MENKVVIVGAGPAGIATAACLNLMSIPNIVLEREDCYASLWKNRAYDRLHLHLGKQFCQLPHMPFPPQAPTFVPRLDFINYLDAYVSKFNIKISYNRHVQCAVFDEKLGTWCIRVKNISELDNVVEEVYVAKNLVVATGENSQGLIPEVCGLDKFGGEVMHSNAYTNGKRFHGKDVLVVGCGNSGMEIAYDLANWGANTSIVARGPVHILSRDMVYFGMQLLSFTPCNIVDSIVVMLSKMRYGNLSSYGIEKPTSGPFYLKAKTGRSPTIDVGAVDKIKKGEIKVFPCITSINEKTVHFQNEKKSQFDAIIFATGYKSTVRNWLKGGEDLFNENGMPKGDFPHHWKGQNGLYCAGFASRGLHGISIDAQNIAKDISLK
ncbi:Flavin-containing monooxygenase family protein [Euphorbia peplus]|nr:Flavin-containing monooxygenase family protein [Euphorbia peplus]